MDYLTNWLVVFAAPGQSSVTMGRIKSRRGRQRKVLSRLVDDLFVALKLDKANWLKDILDGSSSLKEFQALTGESISERENKKV